MNYLIHQYLTCWGENASEKTAIKERDREISYSELESQSNRLSNFLLANHVKRDDRVVVCMSKSINAYISIFAALKAGAIYVPVDPKSPYERLSKIINDASPSFICCDDLSFDSVADLSIPILNFGLKGRVGNSIFHVSDFEASPTILPQIDRTGIDLCYIIYTSGSTGIPKGVMVNHEGVIDFIGWSIERFRLIGSDVYSSLLPLHFDLSIMDIYCSVFTGATVCIVQDEDFIEPVRLLDYVERNGITIWVSVPSLMSNMVKFKCIKSDRMGSLRKVFFGGEVFPTKYLIEWMTAYPEKEFINLYGPTEITVTATYYMVEEIPKDVKKTIPIGIACENKEVFSIDEHGKLCSEVGEIGLLHIRGCGVARGYWGDRQKTDAVFIQNPLNPYFHETVFKTGDLVELLHNNMYRYIDRIDNQIKVMGYRIEPGEIEAAMYKLSYIEEAVCIGMKAENVEMKIVAFVKLSSDTDITEKRIKEDLKNYLPHYMIPRKIHLLKEMPLNPSGKIDRTRLKRGYSL